MPRRARNRRRFVPAENRQSTYLENKIFSYESDTFSSRGEQITRQESRTISNRLMKGFADNRLDGVLISYELDVLRRRT